MFLPDWLHQRARLSPERPALIAGDVRWTFRELDERATSAAAWLRAQGLQTGDRVAVLSHNSPHFVTLVHAVSRLGAILVPLNIRLTPAEIAWQVKDAGVNVLISDHANTPTAQAATAATSETSNLTLLAMEPIESPIANPQSQIPNPQFDLDSPHTILYTSGTTGRPKGARLTYGNHWWNAIGSALNLGLRADDRWLACLPLFHVGGLAILLRGAIYGMSVIVHEKFAPEAVNRAIDDEGVTIVSVVSAMLQRMLEARGAQPYPPTLRCVLLGGGPAPRALLEACAARAIPVVQTYGLTEAASQVATLAPEEALRKLGSAGKPLMPVELAIENPDAQGVGEIVIRGPTVTPGYEGQPDATAHAWRGGWFHTGDMGYVDDDGYLYVLDRRDDLIISGGENVYPAEIESILLAHPAVAEAGVAAMPDVRWGQVPVAFVVLRAGMTCDEDEIKTHCAARLARYKIPARVYAVSALPRTAAGKLLRRELVQIPSRRTLTSLREDSIR